MGQGDSVTRDVIHWLCNVTISCTLPLPPEGYHNFKQFLTQEACFVNIYLKQNMLHYTLGIS